MKELMFPRSTGMKRLVARFILATTTFGLGLCSELVFSRRPVELDRRAEKVQVTANEFQFIAQPIAVDTQPTEARPEVMRPHAVSISPYEIKRLIDD